MVIGNTGVDGVAIPLPERKGRYNLSFTPSEIAHMDKVADFIGCSRSQLLSFCFKYAYMHCFAPALAAGSMPESVAVYE